MGRVVDTSDGAERSLIRPDGEHSEIDPGDVPPFRRHSARHRPMTSASTVVAVVLTVVSSAACADDWPHWRGPQRDGTTQESSRWDGTNWYPAEPVWKANVGSGGTSPLVVKGRVYTMGWQSGADRVVCLDGRNGLELWSREYGAPRYGRSATGEEGLYSGPNSTPEFDPASGFLYTLSCDGDLNCWKASKSGERVWSRDLHDDFQVQQRPRVGRSGHRDFGFTASPLVYGDWLIVEVGAKQGTLIAFDKTTGEPRWFSQAKDPAGHTGGFAPLVVEGVPCLAVMTFEGLLVVRVDGDDAGQTVAQYPWKTDYANNIAGAAASGNSVVVTSAYNQNRIARLEISHGHADVIWEQPFASKICTPIIHHGHIYWCWSQMHCLNFADGTSQWQGGRFGDAGSCLLTADHRLITFSDRGDLRLIESAQRSPHEFHQLAEIPHLFQTDVWPHVALAEGMLLCKDRDGNLIALKK